MNFSILKFLILKSVITAIAAASPFHAKEDLEFSSKAEVPFSDLNKTSDFAGILTRTSESDKALRLVEVYFFSSAESKEGIQKSCKALNEKIFGSFKPDGLTLKSMTTLESEKTGQICEAVITDPDSQALFQERYVFVGNLQAKTYALVFRFKKSATARQKANLVQFLSELH